MAFNPASINVTMSDGGLEAVCLAAGLHKDMYKYFTEQGVRKLDELLSIFTEAGFEAEAAAHVEQVASCKGKLIEIARIRMAYKYAKDVVAHAKGLPAAATAAAAKELELDLEAPLAPEDRLKIAEAWTRRYGTVLDMHLDPQDALVNRLFREFRTNTPSLILVEKVKSVYLGTTPSKERTVTVAKHTQLTFDVEQTAQINGVFEYYWSLRILANASAKAGNYQADSIVMRMSKVTYAPLDVNMNYADRALQMTMDRNLRPHEAVASLREKDLHCRAIMVSKMRSGYPQGEALEAAMTECKVDWTTGRRVKRSRSQPRRERRSRSRHHNHGDSKDKGRGKGGDRDTRKKDGKSADDKRTYAQHLSGGKKACIDFNRGGCSKDENKCPKKLWHRCNIIEKGKVCEGRHASIDHHSR